jgi:hypothetical protein
MAVGAHTDRMTLISAFFFQDAMRRSLLGAHAQDPVVPDGRSIRDRPLRIARFDDDLATLVDARTRRREGAVAQGEPVAARERADERRAA